MANQCEQLARLLSAEDADVRLVRTNAPYRPSLAGRIPILRAGFRLMPYLLRLWRTLGEVDVVHAVERDEDPVLARDACTGHAGPRAARREWDLLLGRCFHDRGDLRGTPRQRDAQRTPRRLTCCVCFESMGSTPR